jgi:hypothetical protein
MAGLFRFWLALGLVLASRDARPLAAQSDARSSDRWQLTLDDAQYVWDVRLVELSGDTLVVRQADSLVRAPLARITEMRRIRKTVMRSDDQQESAFQALTGGDDEVYDLALLDLPGRRRALEGILTK